MSIFFKKNKNNIDKNNLPNCIAFIIDGNGRWAKKKGMPRMYGHRFGIERVKDTIKFCDELKIKEIMFYCFSTENWNRPKPEVDGLFELFRDFVFNEAQKYFDKNIKFVLIGDKTKIPNDILKQSEIVEQKTKDCTGLKVGLCINYGGRFDILNAVNMALKSGKNQIDRLEFEKLLLTNEFHNPDLIVRTGGEMRISNFLLYQMAYSEFYFTKTYWPDFDKKQLKIAIVDFQKRNRRFGAIKE